MPTIISNAGGSAFGGLFPAGYSKMKSTALGDVFPGWSADIIPICINVSSSTDWSVSFSSGQRGYGTQSTSRSLNSKTASSGSTDIGVYCTADGRTYGTIHSYGYSVFLPFFYNFDFDAIKRNVTSGTCTVWLEK